MLTTIFKADHLASAKIDLDVGRVMLGAADPVVLSGMAYLASKYRDLGQWEDAEKLEVQVIETRKTKSGADHPDTLTSMVNLSFTWKSQGRDANALALIESCVQAQRQVLGERHPDTMPSVSTIESWR